MIERSAILPLCLFSIPHPSLSGSWNWTVTVSDGHAAEEKRMRTRRDIGKICKLSCQQHKSHADPPTDWHKRPIKPVTYFTTTTISSSNKSDIIDPHPPTYSHKVFELKKCYFIKHATWLKRNCGIVGKIGKLFVDKLQNLIFIYTVRWLDYCPVRRREGELGYQSPAKWLFNNLRSIHPTRREIAAAGMLIRNSRGRERGQRMTEGGELCVGFPLSCEFSTI